EEQGALQLRVGSAHPEGSQARDVHPAGDAVHQHAEALAAAARSPEHDVELLRGVELGLFRGRTVFELREDVYAARVDRIGKGTAEDGHWLSSSAALRAATKCCVNSPT